MQGSLQTPQKVNNMSGVVFPRDEEPWFPLKPANEASTRTCLELSSCHRRPSYQTDSFLLSCKVRLGSSKTLKI
jgi:hypothetical protein